MKKSISFVSTLALSGMLALPAVVSAQEAATAEEPAVGSSVGPTAFQAGFFWCKGQQSFRYLGDNKTWLLLESCQGYTGFSPFWVWCNDNECEQTLISAAASAHYVGINFTNTAGNWNSIRLYKF